MKPSSLFVVLAALGCVVAGCKGPAGTTGPMGPSGMSSPIYLFNQNFDGASFASQFTVVDPNAVPEGFSAGNAIWVSAPNSGDMAWGGNPGAGAGWWTVNGAWSAAANTNIYFDTYVQLVNFASTGDVLELVLNVGGSTVADCGFTPGSGSDNVYTYESGIQNTIYNALSTQNWHHVVLEWNYSNNESSVTIDGMLLAQSVAGKRALLSGAPNTSVGVYFPSGSASGTSQVWLDNFAVYHY